MGSGRGPTEAGSRRYPRGSSAQVKCLTARFPLYLVHRVIRKHNLGRVVAPIPVRTHFSGFRWCWLSCVLLFPFLLLTARILTYCIMNHYFSHFALQSDEMGREKTYTYRHPSLGDSVSSWNKQEL
jgi:hypothetical protein